MAKLSNNYNAFWQYVNNLNEILEEKELTFEDLVEIGKAVEGGTYQTALTSGDFININDNGVISTTYTSGDNIEISSEGVISATDTTYTAGDGISISEDNEISATSGNLYKHDITITSSSIGTILKVEILSTSNESITEDNILSVLRSYYPNAWYVSNFCHSTSTGTYTLGFQITTTTLMVYYRTSSDATISSWNMSSYISTVSDSITQIL